MSIFFYEGERFVQTSYIGYTTESVKNTLSLLLSLSLPSSSSSSLSRFVVISAAIFRGRKGLVFRVYKIVDFFL